MTPYSATWERFGEALVEAGGVLLPAVSEGSLVSRLREWEPSLVAAGRLATETDLPQAPSDRDALAQIQTLACWADWAVARTGSVRIDQDSVCHRLQILLPERLLVVVPADHLLADLPDLYAAIPTPKPGGWECLVTGPSKTADIERTLVIGAHGPRSLHVLPLLTPTP